MGIFFAITIREDQNHSLSENSPVVISRLISVFLGMLLCWLLNVVQLGIAFVLLSSSEKLLPAVYTLSLALGVVQVGYVVPLWRYMRRKNRRDGATGVLIGAGISLCINLLVDYYFFGTGKFHA
jgi:formate-dependent nitrite reductase membrane component NrfD